MQELSPKQLVVRMRCENAPCVLDVREPWEQELARLDHTIDMPMTQVPDRLDELRDQLGGRDLIVMCHSGGRSSVIVQFLQQNGFERVFNLEGGIQAWAEQVDQTLPTY